MKLQEIQQEVDQWIQTYGVRYFSPLTNTALLMEEVGEFARLLARVYGEQSFKAGEKPVDIQLALEDEMADVFFVLFCLSNQLNIDLEKAIKKNLEKKTLRDNDRHQKNPRLL
jgi:NTP pyrophosphatase (non-canonical NTP hydrolase)